MINYHVLGESRITLFIENETKVSRKVLFHTVQPHGSRKVQTRDYRRGSDTAVLYLIDQRVAEKNR